MEKRNSRSHIEHNWYCIYIIVPISSHHKPQKFDIDTHHNQKHQHQQQHYQQQLQQQKHQHI